MKRFLIPAVMLALFAPMGFTGCADKTEVTKEATIDTPDGSKEVKQTTEIKETGDMKSE